MNIQAVFFDMDGTLLDTLADLADSLNRVLQAQGCPSHPLESYPYFVGLGATELVKRALPPDQRSDASISSCLAAFREEYSHHWNVKTKPYPEVPELLDGLVARQIKTAVLTNKPQRFADLCAQEYLSQWPFALILGQREGVPMKPDPAAPREIAQALDVSLANCLFVGDSGVDMQTAVQAGMFPAGALWGYRPEAELLEHGARELLESPLEIMSLL